MSMVRMFHVECDAPRHRDRYDAYGELGDEYYASEALRVAKEAGYHVQGTKAICGDCWGEGVRYTDFED